MKLDDDIVDLREQDVVRVDGGVTRAFEAGEGGSRCSPSARTIPRIGARSSRAGGATERGALQVSD